MKTPEVADVKTHAALERDRVTTACRQVHSEARVYVNTLVEKTSKRHKTIHNSACRTVEEVAVNKRSAEDMLEKSKKHFGEALANAGQAADAAAKRQLNELQKMEEAMFATLSSSCKQT